MDQTNAKVCRHIERIITEIAQLPDEEAKVQIETLLSQFSPQFKKNVIPNIFRRCSKMLVPYVMTLMMGFNAEQ